jgi:hypothetical protein
MQRFLSGYEDVLDRDIYRPIVDFCTNCRLHPSELNIETLFTLTTLSRPWMDSAEASRIDLTAELVRLLIDQVLELSFPRAERGDGTIALKIQHEVALVNFCKHLLLTDSNVITFNYDILLDHFLSRMRSKVPHQARRFHPQYSYGLNAMTLDLGGVIQPPDRLVTSDKHWETIIQVLKLHGSVNWLQHVTASDRIGESDLCIDDCVEPLPVSAEVRSRFRRSKFIVPPALDKSTTAKHPVLNLLWHRASKLLTAPQKLVFVGYSFPATDFHAEFLFRYYARPQQVIVVSKPDPTDEERELTTARYKSLFPDIPVKIRFDGAEAFCRELNAPTSAADLLALASPTPMTRHAFTP